MPKSRHAQRTRRAIARRANGCCEYCLSQEDYSPSTFSVEHIAPRVQGGSNAASNLALACQECNNRKFTSTESIDPINGQKATLYHPRLHDWADHFAWSEDFLLMQGLTPTGRATIAKLYLNRTGVVNLRRALIALGVHPPTTPTRDVTSNLIPEENPD